MLKSLKKIVSLALVGAAGFGYASEQNPGAMQTCKNHLPTTLPVPM